MLDDIMDKTRADKRISQLLTRVQHGNLPVTYLALFLFHKNRRVISLNSDCIIIFKNPRDRTHFMHLAKQLFPTNPMFLRWVYDDATQTQ